MHGLQGRKEGLDRLNAGRTGKRVLSQSTEGLGRSVMEKINSTWEIQKDNWRLGALLLLSF